MSAALAQHDAEPSSVSGGLAKKIARYPAHIQAGLRAYRAALARRKDWHSAVVAAIEAAETAKRYYVATTSPRARGPDPAVSL